MGFLQKKKKKMWMLIVGLINKVLSFEGHPEICFQGTQSLLLEFRSLVTLAEVCSPYQSFGFNVNYFSDLFSLWQQKENCLGTGDWLDIKKNWKHFIIRGTHRRSNWLEPQAIIGGSCKPLSSEKWAPEQEKQGTESKC